MLRSATSIASVKTETMSTMKALETTSSGGVHVAILLDIPYVSKSSGWHDAESDESVADAQQVRFQREHHGVALVWLLFPDMEGTRATGVKRAAGPPAPLSLGSPALNGLARVLLKLGLHITAQVVLFDVQALLPYVI